MKPVPLNRALSKLGIASRAEATRLIQEGRVKVDGHIVRDALAPVVPERIRVTLDDQPARRASWRTILLHKPRGVVTTTNDPEGRPTVFDLVAALDTRFVSVGRLDLATSGLLLLTTDTRLAAWLTDPANGVKRVYLVSVRGEVGESACEALTRGIEDEGERLAADSAVVRKRSTRETHLVVDLSEGRNREIRRLFEAVGGAGTITLLTDGREVFARTAEGEFINILRAPDQPMLEVGDVPMLRELTARTKPAKRKKNQ
jgi:23S rRNA pseudouridine2605 synthase